MRALVALGTNLPHAGRAGVELLAAALDAIEAAGLPLLSVSSAWESPPWPPSAQPRYVNAAAELDAGAHDPASLYAVLRAVERAFGRDRRERWAARTLDLDVIDLEGFRGLYSGVTIPHPRARERAFVLAPLAEIAPHWHPGEGAETAEALLAGLPGARLVRRLAAIRENMPPPVAADQAWD